MALDKRHKAFRFNKALPIDANNVIFEQAFARFLVLVRTSGLPITSTTKETLHPEDLIEVVTRDIAHFQGIKEDPQRKRLLEHWIANDFATVVREGRSRAGEARIANLKPIHMSTIKLLDPRIRSQDRDVSVFLYNVFRDSGLIIGDQESFMPFLTHGTVDFGEHDLKLDEGRAQGSDIETLFLLRLLENFKVDKADKRRKVEGYDFLCPAQKQLLIHDTARLLVYKDSIPRRELIQYLMTLFSFHTALYCIRSFSIVNAIFDKKKVRCSRCKNIRAESLGDLCECEHHPDIFVDLTNGQDEVCDAIAKEKVARHYAIMHRYFRSHYKLKKLDEFASTFPGYTGSIEELIKFSNHRDLDGYFRVKLGEISAPENGEEQDPEIKSILNLELPPFDAYIEILYQKTFKNRVRNHKKMMASLCGLNQEDGFLHGGRGKQRKYVLGNQLLELLVQLAVVTHRGGQFATQPITISEFMQWIRTRYGILIDTTGQTIDSPEIARALERNYNALKDRLRQLGFFTDLSDASISQVIRPRFPIQAEKR
ncbi:MAG: hypothetical protein LCI00_08355 [Chloroflexi bacterium]|nr:hypothetical protein [Chloroflexota bacterium]